MRPAPDWVATLRERLAAGRRGRGRDRPGRGPALVDWAEYFCRYARDMRPFERRENAEIPGDNCAYRRELLERTRELYRDGFWEPEVNRALRRRASRLWHDPDVVVYQGRSAGFGAFFQQRLEHGRAYGRQRGARFGRAGTSPASCSRVVVPVRARGTDGAEVFSRGRFRGRVLAVAAVLLAFDVAWAAGEARGHLDTLRGR